MMSRPTVELSPEDASNRNIKDGDLVRLFNDRGETFVMQLLLKIF